MSSHSRVSKKATRWALMLFLAVFADPMSAATYHVDADSGNDAKDGINPTTAWQSLARVNQQVFQPGDKLLFKAGTRYAGQFKPQGSGRIVDGQPQPIVMGQYGAGPRPRIDGEGRALDTLLLRNVEFWEVQDLEITNNGTNREAWRTGVRIVSDGFGKMRHIRLRNLFVHDVNGDLRKSREGCGIFFESRGGNQSHFDDLRIENCQVTRTDRNGICQRVGGGAARSLRVVIRGNRLEDIGGDGIKIWGSNGALVEHNTLRGGRTRCDDYAAGIWPFDSDDTVIQFNEVSGMKGTKDGQGFDADFRCRRSVLQYNYSHDNEGGFILICTPGNSWNEDTVVRYNISQNDGLNSARVFHFGGSAKNTRVYNNTIYLGPKQNLPLLNFTEWDKGNADGTRFENNIFIAAGRASFSWGKSRNTTFVNNVFFGNFSEIPAGTGTVTNQQPLIDAGSGGEGFDSLGGYKLRAEAPPLIGVIVPNNGGRDFFGNPVSMDRLPGIGAFQPMLAP